MAVKYVGCGADKFPGMLLPGRIIHAVGRYYVVVAPVAGGYGEVQLPVGRGEAYAAVGLSAQAGADEGSATGIACFHVADEVAKRVPGVWEFH